MFDDAFVRAAPRQELSAAERAARAHRIDADRRLQPAPSAAGRGRRRPIRRGTSGRWSRLTVGLAAVFVVALVAGTLLEARDRATDVPPRRLRLADGTVLTYPPPPAEVSEVPLARPPQGLDDDRYRFGATVAGGEPVRWDPCRPIRLVVAGAGTVPAADVLLAEAVDVVSRATGLVFEVDGPTDEVPAARRRPILDRYGDRWAPVLVAWTDPEHVPRLAGAVAGLGGPQEVTAPDGTKVYVTGTVSMDAPTALRVLARPDGHAEVRAILIHELAHLVGLDHVDDPSQLMYESAGVRVVLGPGDRAGLARLGNGPCVPDL